MKATGIIRKLDQLGRVVLSIELRRTLRLEIEDPLEIFIDGDAVVLKKYKLGCYLCGDIDGRLIKIGDKLVCRACAEKIAVKLTTETQYRTPIIEETHSGI